MELSEEQIKRYSRQIIIKDIGGKGQEKLLNSKILIIGLGGLGSPAALYLSAAGVGTLGIIDNDVVDISNLQRQVIHFTGDLDKPKVISAKEKLRDINPDVNIKTYSIKIKADNIIEIIKDYDFIIDATDNFPAKYLINDACVMNGKPYTHAGILQYEGQTITYIPGNTCLRCLFPEMPPEELVPSCSEAGVLGVASGTLGIIQASEAMKYILEIGEMNTNCLYYIDILKTEFKKIKLQKNPDCPVCGENPKITELIDYNY